jgi:hypothetical protein
VHIATTPSADRRLSSVVIGKPFSRKELKMFTKKAETPFTLDAFARDIEKTMIEARKAHLNAHAIERVLEQALRVHRSYIAASLKF